MKTNKHILFELSEKLSKKEQLFFIKNLELYKHKRAAKIFTKISILLKNGIKISEIEKKLKLFLDEKDLKYYRINKSLLKKELISFLNKKALEDENDFQIRKIIEEGITLLDLNFIDEGIELLDKAKQKAIDEEYFDEVIYALQGIREYGLNYMNYKIKSGLKNYDFINKINEEISYYFKINTNLNAYKALSTYIFSFQGCNVKEKEKLKPLFNHKLLYNEDTALSIRAKQFFYYCWLDLYNSFNLQDDFLKLTLKAIDFAKKCYNKHDNYFDYLVKMCETLCYSYYKNEQYIKALEVIDFLESTKIPKTYKKLHYIRLIILYNRTNIYGQLKHEKFHFYSDEMFNYLKLRVDFRTKLLHYNSLMTFTTLNFNSYEKTIVYFKHFFKTFEKEGKFLNPNYNSINEIFLIYFLSAFKIFSKESFMFFNEKIFTKKNNSLFSNDAPYFHINKIYNVFLMAYDKGFFDREVLSDFFKIWQYSKSINIERIKKFLTLIFKEQYNDKLINESISTSKMYN